MEIKIQEIREFLLENPKYFSTKNNIKIKDIKSQYKYYFIADCNHEFLSLPTNVFIDNRLTCPVCSGRQVVKGVNDLWTTHPEIANMLLHKKDGYKYSFGSNKKLDWICSDCGAIFSKMPIKMRNSLSYCKKCNKLKSYGENFITEMLNQLYEIFEREKIFDWSNNKRYDFYLPYYNCIIEVHGKQHYSNSDFSHLGGKTYIEEQINDEEKQNMALSNGIQNYIIIQSDKSDKNYLRKNILTSLLPLILNFSKDDIDWNQCHKFCMNNQTRLICEYYEQQEKNLNKIAEHFNCSYNTVKTHLKYGAEAGFCSYNSIETLNIAYKENSKRIVETMSKAIIRLSIDGNYIDEFPSIQSAQRELKISHIWDCLTGKRKTAGGYKWKYKEEIKNEY